PVDLSNCDREPIHILGGVQPFGFLLALTPDWVVARVSANIGAFLGSGAEEVLGLRLEDLLTAKAVHDIRNMVIMLREPDAVERGFGLALNASGQLYDIALHFSGPLLVLEAEPAVGERGDAASLVRTMMTRVRQVQNTTQFLQTAARHIRSLTGFDRVKVYKFDNSGSGEVVAEARNGNVDSFLGLHYPATDIPAQARILYTRNLFRIIADINAEPVPIVPQLDQDGAPLDLSLSVLRAVSPIHIEYLRNMGVGASLSISIIVEGRLWGLFACHHYGPRLPNYLERTAAELFGSMFSLMLESRERQAVSDYENKARFTADRLMAIVAQDSSRLADAEWLGGIVAEAIPAEGVGVYVNGRVSLSGLCPSQEQFLALMPVLNQNAASRVFSLEHIGALQPQAAAYANRAAGLLAIPISRTPQDFVVLFRSEQLRNVRWAGNPEKAVEYGPNGPRLTPRKSFEEWSELVKGKAVPFTESELRVAETLRAALLEVILQLADAVGAERARAEERQTLLIAELNHR
ncbi:MAG: GAF domain-containing protein, partial [Rhodospirillales bacterium]|nr:GAF domain-containing protein [Rhodospirillales bacterium]